MVASSLGVRGILQAKGIGASRGSMAESTVVPSLAMASRAWGAPTTELVPVPACQGLRSRCMCRPNAPILLSLLLVPRYMI